MKKVKIISNGKLDLIGMKKIGKSLLLTIGAAVLGWVGNSAGVIDYGSAETMVATFLPFIVNAGYKWLGKYEA
ncbi:hypothetical protein KAR91_06980 [Candidatus Pacearchaeota archaeon]|nr:hypothetical protein [Candidatus Pacearchaeota archaeon]